MCKCSDFVADGINQKYVLGQLDNYLGTILRCGEWASKLY